jgi:hypothetical protein
VPSSDEWSIAIAEWATDGRPEGETVYLSLDLEAINEIGNDRWGIEQGFDDFLKSLREKLYITSPPGWNRTELVLPTGKPLRGGVPDCTAFLAFLVICAAKRGERMPEYVGEGTEFFFPWVKKLLGGLPSVGRSGLGELESGGTVAPEVALWQRWNEYLRSRGFECLKGSTHHGSKKNWGYALDQSILTFSCRRTLAGLNIAQIRAFTTWKNRRRAGRLVNCPIAHATKHLKSLLNNRWEDERVQEAVCRVIEGAPQGPRPSRGFVLCVG